MVGVERDDFAQQALELVDAPLALVQHGQFVLDLDRVGHGLVGRHQDSHRAIDLVGVAQDLRLGQHAQRALFVVLRIGPVHHGQRAVDAPLARPQRGLAHVRRIAHGRVVDAAQLADGFVVAALVFGDARQQHVGVGRGGAGVGGARRGGHLALVLHVEVLLQVAARLVQASRLVGQLGLHEHQVEILGRAPRHRLQLGQRAVVVAAVGDLAGQHQAQLARVRIAVDEGARLVLRARGVDLGAVFEHALRGGLGLGVGGQRGVGFVGGARVVAGGLRHVGQGQVGGGQLAGAVAERFVQDAQRQAAVVQAAEHAHGLHDGRRLVARRVDALAQRRRQPRGLAVGGGQRQLGGAGLDIVGRQAGPGARRIQGARQIAPASWNSSPRRARRGSPVSRASVTSVAAAVPYMPRWAASSAPTMR